MNLCLSQDQVLVISDCSFSLFFKQVNFKMTINFMMEVEYDRLGECSPE